MPGGAEDGRADAGSGLDGQAKAGLSSSGRSRMSLTSLARLPPWRRTRWRSSDHRSAPRSRLPRRRGSAARPGFGVETRGALGDPGFERLGQQQAAGDAGEDQGDVAGAERRVLVTERGDDLTAVVDERPDEGK